MFCSNCGTKLSEDAIFCSECGTKVRMPEEAQAPAPRPAPEKEEAPAVPVPPKEPERAKKKHHRGMIAAAVVLFLLTGAAAAGIFVWKSPSFQCMLALRHGEACMEKGAYGDALEAYEKALEWQPDSGEAGGGYLAALLAAADSYYEQGLHQDACDAYAAVLKKDGGNEAAAQGQLKCMLALGDQCFAEGDYKEALNYFEQVLEKNSDNGEAKAGRTEAWLKLGEACMEKEDYEQAQEYFSEVLKADPDRTDIYVALSQLRLQTGDVMGALEILETGYDRVGDLSLNKKIGEIVGNTVLVSSELNGAQGRRYEEYDDRGNVTFYSYDDGDSEISLECSYDENDCCVKAVSYENSVKTSEQVWEYNEDGLMTFGACYDEKGELYTADYYEYDEGGKEISRKNYSALGYTYETYTEYDEAGNRVNQKTLKDGQLIYYTEYAADREAYHVTYDENGELSSDETYEYDEYGNRTLYASREYAHDYSTVYHYEYQYDDAGRILEQAVTEAVNNEWGSSEEKTATSYRYDGAGNMVYTYCGGEDMFYYWYEYEYDAAGNQLKRSSYNENGGLLEEDVYEYYADGICRSESHLDGSYTEYDEAGRVILERDGEGERIYRYDAMGNPVQELWNGEVVAEYTNVYKYIG